MHSRADALRLAAAVARGFDEPAPNFSHPKIFEFILFGSTSREESIEVHDLDILVLAGEMDDEDNTEWGHFKKRLTQIKIALKKAGFPRIRIDFYNVETWVLWDEHTQKIYRHIFYSEKDFIGKILQSFLRWNSKTGCFERANRAYLDKHIPQTPV